MNNPSPQPTQPEKRPPLTTGQKIRYSLFAIGFLALVGILIGMNVGETSRDNQAKDNGTKYTAVSTGDYSERNSIQRRGSGTVYRAYYTFTDNEGVERRVLGEKEYDLPDDIKADAKVDVFWNPDGEGSRSYVENEP